MENPFFGGFWDRVPDRRSYHRPRYYHPNPYAATSYATPVKSDYDYQSAPKIKPHNVVSIPVNFVNSDSAKTPAAAAKKAAVTIRMDETTAAVKIQAAFRGFRVRKPQPLKKLRVIMNTKAEAADIQRRVSDSEVVELIRRDEKERLKITEWIMSLLLRLDAIQGVNSFVRESRKAVTRELVNLQEIIDDIIAGKSSQHMTTEASMNLEAGEECPDVEENAPAECLQVNSNGEIKDELLGLANEVAVNDGEAEQNEMGEEDSLPSQMQDLQIENSPEKGGVVVNDAEAGQNEMGEEESLLSQVQDSQIENSPGKEEDNNGGIGNFDQSFSEAKQTVSGPEECVTVDGAGEDGRQSKENMIGSTVSKPDTSQGIVSEEDVMMENSKEDERVETIQFNEKLEADVDMDREEAGYKLPEKEEGTEDIGMVREENERLQRTVSDLLKKSELQSEMINNLSLRISQLEEQVSRCSKKKKIGDGKKQSSASADERVAPSNDRRRRKMERHLKNGYKEDWF